MKLALRSVAAPMLFAILTGCAAQTPDGGGELPVTDAPQGSTASAPSDETVTQEGQDKVSTSDLDRGRANVAGIVAPSGNEDTAAILEKYAYVDPDKEIPTELLASALVYYATNVANLQNPDYLTVVDMFQHSKERRFFLIDMKTGDVERHVVAHGKGSDPEWDGTPHIFSNVDGSLATSLGFYKTAETFNGDNGYSLRLDGLSATNSHARERAIIVHGASYVNDGSPKQGRSWGCPALPKTEVTAVIDKIKGGSLIYVDLSGTPANP